MTAFAWTVDPREDVVAWRVEAAAGIEFETPSLHLAFGMAGPGALSAMQAAGEVAVGSDRFGIRAETTLEIPAGRWAIRTTSDDGIRVWLDDDLARAPRADHGRRAGDLLG